MKKSILVALTVMMITINVSGQQKSASLQLKQDNKFDYKPLIIPSILIGYGALAFGVSGLKKLDNKIQKELSSCRKNKFKLDDYIQYLPFASVYGLNLCGVEGRHNFKDRTIILGTSYLIMGMCTLSTKQLISEERPDGRSDNAFVSGHTATAFMGAEFLYQEYKHKSILYGLSGYLVASSVGFLRMYNNRHWFKDVVAGAGVGILSTKIAYLIHPFVKRLIFGKDTKGADGIVMPFYNGKEYGLSLSMRF